jgi:starvation-inducible DNA-binding protein
MISGNVRRTENEGAKTSTDISVHAVPEISGELRRLLADVFGLYLKRNIFDWPMTGRHFRDYRLLLDEHATQILAMTDEIAERARKVGGATLRLIGDIARKQRIAGNDDARLSPGDMLSGLRDDDTRLGQFLRSAHGVCGKHGDVATILIETWIDETERRAWFLSEIASEA